MLRPVETNADTFKKLSSTIHLVGSVSRATAHNLVTGVLNSYAREYRSMNSYDDVRISECPPLFLFFFFFTPFSFSFFSFAGRTYAFSLFRSAGTEERQRNGRARANREA